MRPGANRCRRPISTASGVGRIFDTGEHQIRYLEVALDKDFAKDAARDYALIPFAQARLDDDNDHVVVDLSSTNLAYDDERHVSHGGREQTGAADRATRGGIADRVTDAADNVKDRIDSNPASRPGPDPTDRADLANRDVADAPSRAPAVGWGQTPDSSFQRRRWSDSAPGSANLRGSAAAPKSLGMKPVQDLYPDDFAHCYGCGRLNADGLHIKTEWHDGEAVAHFHPAPQHIALPGFVYGGLIASLIDCHAMATAAAASMEKAGATPGVDPTPRFVTASLQVDYLRPTPLGPELELRSRATEVGERKVLVEVMLRAGDLHCARGRVVAVRMPAAMAQPTPDAVAEPR